MRILLAMPLLLLGACSVNNDANNDQVTIQYDQNEMDNVASDMGDAAQNAGEAIGNVADDAAAKVRNTDVDVNVNTHADDDGNAADGNHN